MKKKDIKRQANLPFHISGLSTVKNPFMINYLGNYL